jgi:predicted DNA-binding protein (MmcQ/YjbR family)
LDLESFRERCLSKKGVTEEFPFGEDTIVFKVMGKMFTLADVVEFSGINVKVDPEKGIELRERYDAITPAFHMNKKHWITAVTNGMLPEKLLMQLIDDSYLLVVNGLTKSQKSALQSM